MLDLQQQLHNGTVYIKPVYVPGATVYRICSNEGLVISDFAERESAFACAKMHDLIPMSLH